MRPELRPVPCECDVHFGGVACRRDADSTYVLADNDVAALCEFCARAHDVPRA